MTPPIDDQWLKRIIEQQRLLHNSIDWSAFATTQRAAEQMLENFPRYEEFATRLATIDLTALPAITKAMKQWADIQSSMSTIGLDFTALQTQFTAMSHGIAQMQKLAEMMRPQLAAIEAISQSWQQSLTSYSSIQAFQTTFGGRVIQHLSSIQSSTTEEEIEDSLGELVELVVTQAAASKTPAEKLGLAFAIASLLFAIYTFIAGNEHQADVVRRLTSIEAKLTKQAQHAHQREPIAKYVTTEYVHLRAGPGTKFDSFDKLSPNTLVLVLGTKGNWLQVHAYDFVHSTVQEGWVYKRFLIPAQLPE